MDVHRFTEEYELVAPLYGVEPAGLRQSDGQQGRPVRRWFVLRDGQALGAVTTWLRPDDRLFLMFKLNDTQAYGPLVAAVDAELDRPLSTMVDAAEEDRVEALVRCGFTEETVGERFRLRFATVLSRLERAWVPSGYEIRSVRDVDQDKAFALDNAVRNLVPGSDGWAGDADWFADELRSPEFDPDAYLIAVHKATDAYVGLIRIWRNSDGPRLGLIGVRPEHRTRSLAAALLRQALVAASEWGYDSFITETSPSNRHIYPAIARLEPLQLGAFLQLVRT